jgi:cytochrome oxidase Cu insertion factor (SCO1/SenC/PrrC family)
VVWTVVAVVVAAVVAAAVIVGRRDDGAGAAPGPETAGGREDEAPPPPPTTGLFEKPIGQWLDIPAVERSGRELRTAELVGRYLVVDFVFSSCAGTCPPLQAAMQSLQEATKDAADVRLVSLSVDPEHDTPELLRGWADAYKADPERWLFLRADAKDVRRLMTDGLKVGGGEELILHSNLFLVVDPTGAVRGRYTPLDHANWREVLLADLAKLRAETAQR